MEVYVYAERVVPLLRLDLCFSATANTPFKDPETLLVASIVLAVKLLYPLSEDRRYSTGNNETPSLGGLRLDWTQWAESYKNQNHGTDPGRDFEKTTSADVYDMTYEDMDSYLDWYQETQITADQGLRRVVSQDTEKELTT